MAIFLGWVINVSSVYSRTYQNLIYSPPPHHWLLVLQSQVENNVIWCRPQPSTIDKSKPITLALFNRAYKASLSILPNNNILSIISKAREPNYQDLVIDLFRTTEKIEFQFDDDDHNFLYMNGVLIRKPLLKIAKRSIILNRNRIFQVLSNLIDNALKYIMKGSIS